MAVINILGFIVLILLLAYITKEKIVDVLPAAACILIVVLYILAFFKCLSFIDYLSIGLLIAVAFIFFRQSVSKRKEIRAYLWRTMKDPGTIVICLTIVAVTFLVRNKLVTWWDDYNFWATDVKSLFYLDGFAGKYANVAPEFGDYPPGTQMMKWWFLHFSPKVFNEGLMFAGYYFLNLVFLAPLLRFLKGKNIIIIILCGAALWSFPNVAEGFYLDGTCADLTMALIYGAFLSGVLDREGHKEYFYYGRMALYLMVLVLTKNVAFVWAAFGLLFAFLYHIMYKMKLGKWMIVAVCAVVSEISWLSFCLIMRRVAKLTGAAVTMASSGVNLPGYTRELVNSFLTAFVSGPLHRYRTAAIDITPLGMVVLILLLFLILLVTKKVEKRTGILTITFLLFSGMLYYVILLISHLTIFAVETQYLDTFSMISSIERYGAPFTIGSLYVAAYLFLRQTEGSYKGYIICFLIVFLTIDYQSVYRGIKGYETTIAQTHNERYEIMDENARQFLQEMDDSGLRTGRILYLKDQSDISWVQHAYLGFEASPFSMITRYADGDITCEEDIFTVMEASHAQYVYVNQLEEEKAVLFQRLAGEEEFCFQRLYRIEHRGGKMRLTEVGILE